MPKENNKRKPGIIKRKKKGELTYSPDDSLDEYKYSTPEELLDEFVSELEKLKITDEPDISSNSPKLAPPYVEFSCPCGRVIYLGYKNYLASEAEVEHILVCPLCGYEIDDDKSCSSCGAKFENQLEV